MANPNIGKEGEKYQFKKGESGNPNGRPPKLLNAILKDLKSKGYKEIKADNVKEAYQWLLALPLNELKDIVEDEDQPILLNIVAGEMLSKNGAFMLEKVLDRAQGKAVQRQEVTGKDGKDLFDEMTDEDLKKEIERLRAIQDIKD